MLSKIKKIKKARGNVDRIIKLKTHSHVMIAVSPDGG